MPNKWHVLTHKTKVYPNNHWLSERPVREHFRKYSEVVSFLLRHDGTKWTYEYRE